ncbi:hypothetical protein F4821DRAFT_263026 [Hypoxylon rubiginosum]|uniref:Uncharacterized protein n=1 Tax=Hypoxylon rubiginosum TaxID=110542 RepID=A0ACC0CT41_9PEZI|nr:hypothetical protein F4821DRAFT_263026 [Hypoxylon rubiginosum]
MSEAALEIPRQSAWAANREEVRDFVSKGQDTERSRVTYLQSSYASGKSTTMLLYLMDYIHKIITTAGPKPKATPWFVYVLPRQADATLLGEWLASEPPKDDGIFESTSSSFEDRFVITTYRGFLESLDARQQKKEGWHKRVHIMADVELRASVDGEIFFGRLAELVQKNDPIVNLLLVSPQRSHRTIKAFERVAGRVQEIVVPNVNPQLRVKSIEGHDWMDKAAAIVDQVLRADQEARVFVGMSDPRYLEQYLAQKGTAEVELVDRSNVDNLKDLIKERVIAVHPELNMSASTDNLRLVISQCTAESVIFDKAMGQLLECERELSLKEIEQEQSWALKTSLDLDDVDVYVAISKKQYKAAKNPNDPWSPAWNVHLPWLTLRLFQTWPDIKLGHLPIRHPPDVPAFSETVRRMYTMGFLERDEGRFSTSMLGRHAVYWMDRWAQLGASATHQMQAHAAYLLAVASKKQDTPNVVRVLIRLGLISARGIGMFCTIANPAKGRPSDEAVRSQCAGIGEKLYWKGALWTALGVYLKGVLSDHFRPDSSQDLQLDWALVDPLVGFNILRLTREIEKAIGLPPVVHEIQDTMLNDDEILTVEKYIMWAWLYRVLGIRCKGAGDVAFELTTGNAVEVSEAEDLLDISLFTKSRRHNKIGGICVIYDRLVRSKGKVMAYNLTYIPQKHYQDVVDKTGLTWPSAIHTKYPLQQVK